MTSQLGSEKIAPHQIEILKPELTDLPAVLEMWKKQHDLHLVLDPEYYTENSERLDEDARGYFREAVQKDRPHIRIAKLQGQIVGFITYTKSAPEPGIATSGSNVASHVEVVDLFVEDSVRNRNIGQHLMSPVIDYAKQEGIKNIMVEVSASNPGAQRFYERSGFIPRQVKSYLAI